MKAIFALFVIVAIIGMAMAGVHHYRVKGGEDKDVAPQHYVAPQHAVAPQPDSAHHGGSIFDLAANGLNAIGTGIRHAASGIFG